MDDKTLWIIIAALGILVFILAAVLGVLIFIYFKSRDKLEEAVGEGETNQRLSLATEAPPRSHYCINHPQESSAGECAICHELFCDECVSRHEGLIFCKDHILLYLENDWIEIIDIQQKQDDELSEKRLWALKTDLWRKRRVPTILSTHFKINIENDHAEAYLKFYVRKQEEEEIRQTTRFL